MNAELTTYDVAGFIHDAVWQRNDLLPEELLITSSFRRNCGHMTNTEQVICLGNGDPAQPALETLTKGRNGLYYFQATEGYKYTGTLSLGRHVIAPSSGSEIAQRFASSLIISEFMRLTEES